MNRTLSVKVFLASNSLHNHGGQKLLCQCYNRNNFEQIHWNKLFCGMYGLAVMLSIPRQTTSRNINEIQTSQSLRSNLIISMNIGSIEFIFTLLCKHRSTSKKDIHLHLLSPAKVIAYKSCGEISLHIIQNINFASFIKQN